MTSPCRRLTNGQRVLVYVDGNHNGVADAGEQRLAAVAVRLRNAPCASSGADLQIVNSDSGGVATFNPLASGPTPVCAQAIDGLPDDLLPASLIGVNVPRGSGEPVALALQATGTVTVRPFLDSNSNGVRETSEAYLSGGTVTIDGQVHTIGVDGAQFSLAPGSYGVQIAPPTGYASVWTQPIGPLVVTAAPQTLLIPLRDASGVSGKIWPPNTGGFSLGGGSLAVGLTVQLQNTATNATIATTSDSAGNFSFSNVPPATYRLRLPAPPPGYVASSEPLLTYQSGQVASNNNLHLVPVGHIVGVVYHDGNGNQQWDNNEPGVDDYAVRLMGGGGQEVAVAMPDAAGYFRFEGLAANTPYALQLANMPAALFITASPGVFTVGADPQVVQLGVDIEGTAGGLGFQAGGTVSYQQGDALIPIAGAARGALSVPAGERRLQCGKSCHLIGHVHQPRRQLLDARRRPMSQSGGCAGVCGHASQPGCLHK